MSSDERDSRVKALLNLINLSAAYKACFCDRETGKLSKDGERVMRDLMHFGRVNRSPLVVSPLSRQVDTHATCTAIGRAEAVRHVWHYLDMDPTQHPLMKESTHDD